MRRRTAWSVSLPGESHPLITNLEEQIGAIRSWIAGADSSLALIETGLSHIELLLLAMNEFLNLSETITILKDTAAPTECLLKNLLCLIDSYGSFLSEIVSLKQHHFEVQSALRRHDSTLLSCSLKSRKRIEKQISHLACSLYAATKCLHLGLPSDASEAEIVQILKEVISAASAASIVFITRVVTMSAASSSAAASLALCNLKLFKKRISEGEKETLINVKLEELVSVI